MEREKPEDEQLLRLMQSDPEKGIRQLQKAYGGLVLHIVSRVLPQNPQDAEEIAADVLVAAWKQSQKLLLGKMPLAAWLTVTARNRAIDRWRALTRKPALPLLEELEIPDETSPSEGEETIAALVAQMDEPDREIFLRRYYRLETAQEIGTAIGMQPNTVNAHLSRGRARLKQQYLQIMGKGNDKVCETRKTNC